MRLRSVRHLLSCVLLAACARAATTQAAVDPKRPPLPVERLPVNGALSQNSVTHMLQDRTGLMWFATLGGVNVFDGYSYRTFASDPRDPDSLSGVLVSRLFEDCAGGIWVGGFHGWLDRIDPGTGKVRRFPRTLFGPADRPPAVNVSMRQLRSGTLPGTIRAALAEFGVAASGLKLEITESAMMENVEDTAEQLREIKALGVFLSVDDFGTGFSSLAHLKMLPVDEMKIDRSFIADVAANEHSQKIVSSIVRLALELQLQVVAEGVEEESAVTYLRSIDCDLAQGYLFERPQPPEKLEANGWLDPDFAFPRRLTAVG